jgi:hypothetical protein
MLPKTLKGWFFLLVVIGALIHFYNGRSTHKRSANTATAGSQPIQAAASAPKIQLDPFTIEPVAGYEIRAKVLSIERYYLGREAELSPVDFALGWGPMSDDAVISQLNISQGNRWYQYRWPNQPPIAPDLIAQSSANTHLVPANDDIKAKLLRVKKGEIVQLKGFLINVKHEDGWMWRSSLTRDDTGGGSCELMWVVDVVVE